MVKNQFKENAMSETRKRAKYTLECRQVHEAFGHGNVGRVQRPDLVGAIDVQLAQQVGVDLVAKSGLAGTRLRRMSARSASLTGLGR